MADELITGLAALTTPASGDLLCIVDVSDTTMAATGTDKKITVTYLFGAIPVNIVQGDGLNIQTDKVRARDGDGLYLVDDGDNGLFIADGGNVFLSDTANAKMTLGLTINQGANDSEILALKSSDIAHGMTTQTETDTFFLMRKISGDAGGAYIRGFGESAWGFLLDGCAVNDVVAKSAAAQAYVGLSARKKTGTTVGAVGANANLVVVRDLTSTRAIIDAEGELHLDLTVAENAWDEYDDLELITALRASVMSPKTALYQRTKHLIEKHRDLLEETGVITYNEDGHHFIAMKAFTFLLADAIRQVGARLQMHEQALLGMGALPKLLEA